MFTSENIEALTMLYLEKQDLSEITPEELVEKYLRVKDAINDAINRNHGETHVGW